VPEVPGVNAIVPVVVGVTEPVGVTVDVSAVVVSVGVAVVVGVSTVPVAVAVWVTVPVDVAVAVVDAWARTLCSAAPSPGAPIAGSAAVPPLVVGSAA